MRSPSFASRALVVASLLAGLCGCVHGKSDQHRRTGTPRAFKLLEETPERETTDFPEKRLDVEIDTQDHERTPRVVEKGETQAMTLDGARARLYGDAAGKRGWSVDNLVLLEILDPQGKIIGRGAVGFSDGVDIGANRVDNVGKLSFTFDPGEVDITSLLPESGSFRIRATALDYFGVGRVTDLYLLLEYPATPGADDFRILSE